MWSTGPLKASLAAVFALVGAAIACRAEPTVRRALPPSNRAPAASAPDDARPILASRVPTSRMRNRAGHCPSAVPGAETRAIPGAPGSGDVIVMISATDPAAVAEIRERAAYRQAVQRPFTEEIFHTGQGTGGGQGGLCPVFAPPDGTFHVSESSDGVNVVIRTTPEDADDLLARVQSRITRLDRWLRARPPGA